MSLNLTTTQNPNKLSKNKKRKLKKQQKNKEAHNNNSKMQNIFYNRLQAVNIIIDEIKAISIIGHNKLKDNLKIGGLYKQLIKYLFSPTTNFKFNDDVSNLPDTMYLYVMNNYINYGPDVLRILLQVDKLIGKEYNGYKFIM